MDGTCYTVRPTPFCPPPNSDRLNDDLLERDSRPRHPARYGSDALWEYGQSLSSSVVQNGIRRSRRDLEHRPPLWRNEPSPCVLEVRSRVNGTAGKQGEARLLRGDHTTIAAATFVRQPSHLRRSSAPRSARTSCSWVVPNALLRACSWNPVDWRCLTEFNSRVLMPSDIASLRATLRTVGGVVGVRKWSFINDCNQVKFLPQQFHFEFRNSCRTRFRRAQSSDFLFNQHHARKEKTCASKPSGEAHFMRGGAIRDWGKYRSVELR